MEHPIAKNLTFFDVEYANPKNRPICQIGILCEDLSGEPVFPELNLYVNPEDKFDTYCVKIHGITQEKVASERTFPEIWKEIEKYFTKAVVVGHNVAGADLDALVKNLRRYNIDVPVFYYICTKELAEKYMPTIDYRAKYSLASLCEYFDIDMDSEHDAFDDACACADLFKTLVDEFSIDIDAEVRRYYPHETEKFQSFICDPELRRTVSDLYGVVRGFSLDNVITEDEFNYIKSWRKQYSIYDDQIEISTITSLIDKIAEDGAITNEEIVELQSAIGNFLDTQTTASSTLATQILDGMLRGIAADGKITEDECKNLMQWLYDNMHLANHFPFNQTFTLLEKVLEDSIITTEESQYINTMISQMLDPVNALHSQINSIEGTHICLSGVFDYGEKSKVEEYIVERGGFIDSSVKKTTDILLIGGLECQAYSNGTYGTKVKKAIEYNGKGCNIQIVKEADFFASTK